LVGDSSRETSAAWSFVRSGAVTVLPIDDSDMAALEALMKKYRDRPMDFADATLVRLAQRESLTNLFTIGHDDFETYRIAGKRRFRIFPTR
jgi:predicted nucleic acid-binding protein